MMSAKMATLGLLKRKLFRNKGYYVIIFSHDVTNKILSRDKKNHFLEGGLGSSSIIWNWLWVWLANFTPV